MEEPKDFQLLLLPSLMTNSFNDSILSDTHSEQKLPTVDSQTIGEKKNLCYIAEKPVSSSK